MTKTTITIQEFEDNPDGLRELQERYDQIDVVDNGAVVCTFMGKNNSIHFDEAENFIREMREQGKEVRVVDDEGLAALMREQAEKKRNSQ